MKVVSAEIVRGMDATAIAAGTPGLVLMERAGIALTHILRELLATRYAGHVDQITIVAGRGNNGGDGFVMARLLADEFPVSVYAPCPRVAFTGDARINADRIPNTVSFRTVDHLPTEALRPRTLIVDAMLGTGVTGPAREPFLSWIQQINDANLPVVAVDLPSGLHADNGSNAATAVKADCTITIGAPKTGLYLGDGPACSGIIRFAPIGLRTPKSAESAFQTPVLTEILSHLQPLATDRHKGSMGRVRIIGGCSQYRGAPILAGCGAVRAGAGLVSVAVPAGITVSTDHLALMIMPIGDPTSTHHAPLSRDPQENLTDAQDVLVIGPGLGRSAESADFARQLLNTNTSLVIDADGLEAIDASSLPLTQPTVLTPHPGEFARLATRLDWAPTGDRIADAATMAQKTNAVVVLKGQRTVIADPSGNVSVCGRGCGALATGGSGDVLAGLIGAYLARFAGDPYLAATVGVWIHAAASEQSPFGESGFTADDLPQAIAQFIRLLSPRA